MPRLLTLLSTHRLDTAIVEAASERDLCWMNDMCIGGSLED